MANTILHKRSSVTTNIPLVTNLALGELAVNTFDGRLFMKKNDGVDSIVEITGGVTNPMAADLNVGSFSIVSVSGGNIVITPDTTGNLILDGLNWPQADGTATHVLSTNGLGQLSWVAPTIGTVTNPMTTDLNVSTFLVSASASTYIDLDDVTTTFSTAGVLNLAPIGNFSVAPTSGIGTGRTATVAAGISTDGVGGDSSLAGGQGATIGGNATISGGFGAGGAGGNATISGGDTITTTMVGGDLILLPGSGPTDGQIVIASSTAGEAKAATLAFRENNVNGTNIVGLKAPAAIAADVTWTLPQDTWAFADGKFMTSDASGVLGFAVTGDAFAHIALNDQIGTAYTLVLSDDGKLVTMTNAGVNTLTIPTNASVPFPIGTQILVERGGVGATTIAGGGVILHSAGGLLSVALQYGRLTLIKKAIDTWSIAGDLA